MCPSFVFFDVILAGGKWIILPFRDIKAAARVITELQKENREAIYLKSRRRRSDFVSSISDIAWKQQSSNIRLIFPLDIIILLAHY